MFTFSNPAVQVVNLVVQLLWLCFFVFSGPQYLYNWLKYCAFPNIFVKLLLRMKKLYSYFMIAFLLAVVLINFCVD